MGYKVIWTDEAIADLRQIVARIAQDSPSAAVKMGEEVIHKSLLLADYPRMGRVLREVKRDTLREIMIQPYRLIYEINDASSTVMLRVLWHGARCEPEIK